MLIIYLSGMLLAGLGEVLGGFQRTNEGTMEEHYTQQIPEQNHKDPKHPIKNSLFNDQGVYEDSRLLCSLFCELVRICWVLSSRQRKMTTSMI